jgi:hypothetical protein
MGGKQTKRALDKSHSYELSGALNERLLSLSRKSVSDERPISLLNLSYPRVPSNYGRGPVGNTETPLFGRGPVGKTETPLFGRGPVGKTLTPLFFEENASPAYEIAMFTNAANKTVTSTARNLFIVTLDLIMTS